MKADEPVRKAQTVYANPRIGACISTQLTLVNMLPQLVQFIWVLENTTFTSHQNLMFLVVVAGIIVVVAMEAVATVVEFLFQLSVASFQFEPIPTVKINTKGAVLVGGVVEIGFFRT